MVFTGLGTLIVGSPFGMKYSFQKNMKNVVLFLRIRRHIVFLVILLNLS